MQLFRDSEVAIVSNHIPRWALTPLLAANLLLLSYKTLQGFGLKF